MISADSRYQDAAKAFTVGHTYDEFGRIYLNGDDQTPLPRTQVHETLFRLSVPVSTVVAPVDYFVREGETMSFVSWKLLAAHSNWWQLADANPNIWYPLDLRPGTQLKVPA